jgi:hypothetical protein
MSEVRAAVPVLLATYAAAVADPVIAAVEDDHAIVCTHCDDVTTCFSVDPETGKGLGLAKPPTTAPKPTAPRIEITKLLDACGKKCKALRTELDDESDPIVAIDPSGKRLFHLQNGYYPAWGNTWSLASGKRIARFEMDVFDGPPPPIKFDNARWVGRHIFVGGEAADSEYTFTYDVFTGARLGMFQATIVGTFVVEADGRGRIDLRDFTQPLGAMVATRRVKAQRPEPSVMIAKTLVFGAQALVVVDEPRVSLLVDTRKRTVSRPRPLPACPKSP